ncbi:MAG: replication initiation protein, partial [Cetobacterium sp.]
MNKIIKYHNDLNSIYLSHLESKQLDLFFSLLYKFKEKGTEKEVVTFSELARLTEHTRIDYLVEDIEILYDKLFEIHFKFRTETTIKRFSIFQDYEIDKENKKVSISISSSFSYMLNDLLSNFTLLDLKALISLKSRYSKEIYRKLKQWESVKKYKVSLKDFTEMLSVPKSYRMTNINQYILNPTLIELEKYFKELKILKIKNGTTITDLVFTWKSEERAVKRDVGSVVMRTGLTAEDYHQEFSEVEEREEVKIELTAEEIHLKEFKSYLQKKSQ